MTNYKIYFAIELLKSSMEKVLKDMEEMLKEIVDLLKPKVYYDCNNNLYPHQNLDSNVCTVRL